MEHEPLKYLTTEKKNNLAFLIKLNHLILLCNRRSELARLHYMVTVAAALAANRLF